MSRQLVLHHVWYGIRAFKKRLNYEPPRSLIFYEVNAIVFNILGYPSLLESVYYVSFLPTLHHELDLGENALTNNRVDAREEGTGGLFRIRTESEDCSGGFHVSLLELIEEGFQGDHQKLFHEVDVDGCCGCCSCSVATFADAACAIGGGTVCLCLALYTG